MKLKQIKKPIGDFILKNARGNKTENGVYYHFVDVCRLLKIHKKTYTKKQKDLLNYAKSELSKIDSMKASKKQTKESIANINLLKKIVNGLS